MRRVSAILRQDHPILPLSVRENILIGSSGCDISQSQLEDAIERGGSGNFIKKLQAQDETVLEPIQTVMTYLDGEDQGLKEEVEDVEKKINISGGESQRLAAYVLFLVYSPGLLIDMSSISKLNSQVTYFHEIEKYGYTSTSG